MRAQASIDFLIIVGITLVLIYPLWAALYDSLRSQDDNLRVSYAQTAVARLKQAADIVYVQGAPAQTRIGVYVPVGVLNSSVGSPSSKTIQIQLAVRGGTTDVFVNTLGPLVGSLPKEEGHYQMIVKAEANGFVNITR